MISENEEIELDDIRGVGLPYAAQPAPSAGIVSLDTLEDFLQQFNLDERDMNVLDQVEKVLIDLAMNQSGQNMSQAANLLGINYKQVARRLQKYEGSGEHVE